MDRTLTLPMPEIRELCRRYQVRELSLFGSALRDDFRPDSDYDFLVEFEPDAHIGLMAFIGFQHALEALLGRNVDLVTKSGLKSRIRDSVLSSARLIYAK